MAQPLTGIRVLDLSRLLPGPFCTQLLCDLGAEVIKIERPGEGDYSRTLHSAIRGYGSTFLMLNQGKKSLGLDLKRKSGQEVFRRLAGQADVVVESFRPGVVERLGISWERLRRDNPRLVYCSLTGYGQTGPYAGRAGHDLNYLSVSGLASLTGPRGGKPVPPGFQAADIAGGGLLAALGIMIALYHRERTGRGQYLDVAMLDGLLAVGQTLFGEFFSRGVPPGPGTMRLSGGFPPYDIYETRDGKWVALAALEEKFFQVFCEKTDRQDLIPLHETAKRNEEDREKLASELAALFKTKTREEWSSLLADTDACLTPVLQLHEVMEDPQVKARELFFEAPHPEQGTIPQVRFPIVFSEISARPAKPAPRLAEHTEEILHALGYTKEEIEELKKQGVVGSEDSPSK